MNDWRCEHCAEEARQPQATSCAFCGAALHEWVYAGPGKPAPFTVELDPVIVRWLSRRPGGVGGNLRKMMLDAFQGKDRRFKGGMV